MKVIPQTRHAH